MVKIKDYIADDDFGYLNTSDVSTTEDSSSDESYSTDSSDIQGFLFGGFGDNFGEQGLSLAQIEKLKMDSGTSSEDEGDSDDDIWQFAFVAPITYKGDVSRVKHHHNQSKLKPLKNLCMHIVSSNFNFFRKMQDPFACLSPEVMEDLVKFFEESMQGRVSYRNVLMYIICSKTKYLNIDLDDINREHSRIIWTRDTLAELFSAIGSKCQENLRTLGLSLSSGKLEFLPNGEEWTPDYVPERLYMCDIISTPRPTLTQMHGMLGNLRNLQDLHLVSCNLGDETMAIIGSTCQNLKNLDISCNPVTYKGLNFLCNAEAPHGKCTALTHLDVEDTNLNPIDLVTAICKMPKLIYLIHSDVGKAVLCYAQKMKELEQLKLEFLKFDYDENALCTRTNKDIQNICKMLPSVKMLIVGTLSNLEPLKNLTKVESLIFFKYETPNTFLDISPLIIQFSSKLTKLVIISNTAIVDPTLIAYHCTNLEELIVRCISVAKCCFALTEKHLVKLIRFDWICIKNSKTNKIPGQFLECVLSSENLQHFDLRNIKFPAKVMSNMVEKAKVNTKLFSNLTNIDFLFCHSMPMQGVVDLICVSPKLETINLMGSCKNVMEWKALRSFIQTNGLKIKVQVNLITS